MGVLIRYFRPHEHGAFGAFNFPSRTIQPIDERIPAVPVCLAYLFDTVLGFVEGDNRCDLNGLKNTVIQILMRFKANMVSSFPTQKPTRHPGML